MVVLEDNSKPYSILTVRVLVDVAHIDLELQVRDEELHPEVESLGPLSEAKFFCRPVIALLIWAGNHEVAGKRRS